MSKNAKYISVFLAVFGMLIGLNFWAIGRLISFRETPILFSSLPEDSLVITLGLTRRQAASMKIGFIENAAPPRVGLFGNHSFQYFNGEVFGESDDPFYFFNFWYTNLGLPEMYYYIKYLAKIDKLPKETVLVQITTPNNDNGEHIITYGGELPRDMVDFDDAEGFGDRWGKVAHLYQDFTTTLKQEFNYAAFIFGGVKSRPEGRVLHLKDCDDLSSFKATYPAYFDSLPITLRNVVMPDDSRKYCDKTYWWYGLRPDGANDARYANGILLLNMNPLNENSRALRLGDENLIASYMRAIDAVVDDAGRKAVFIIPPVYETERPSAVDNVFSAALKLVPELNVVDHRHIPERFDLKFYVSYDHPAPSYFEFLVRELRQRGFVQP